MSRRKFNAFAKDSSGSVFVYTAASLAVLLGMAGLAVDLGYWYWSQRDMQSAADSAAMSAALEMARGATPAEIETRARDSATLNGYQHGLATLVTINRPPAAGVHAGDNNYVEAIVQQDQSGFVSAMVHSGDMTVAARAVATLAGAPSCVIALDPSADGAISVEGNTTVDLDCGAQANSNSATAITQQGGKSNITAESIQAVGGYSGSNFTPMPQTGMAPTGDPFAYLQPPASGPCIEPPGAPKTYVSSFSGTIPVGNYCGGIVIQGADVIFETGVYTLGEAGMEITGNATVTNEAGGVTFYIPDTAVGLPSTCCAGQNHTVYIAGTTSVTLSAPTAGPYDGILFYQDPASDPTLVAELQGGSDMSLSGALYFPGQEVYYAGNNVANPTTWTALIASQVHFVGTSYMSSGNFAAAGISLPLALASPSLAE
ncbi:MAG: pilus assembly protein TadG-related protein [Rhodospirillales bacterium]|nr:pilus assembly protein TadG-related protein [Rhodospirillales bacterium]